MGYLMVTCPVTSRDPERWCEAVRSAILATAWLLVHSSDGAIPTAGESILGEASLDREGQGDTGLR